MELSFDVVVRGPLLLDGRGTRAAACSAMGRFRVDQVLPGVE